MQSAAPAHPEEPIDRTLWGELQEVESEEEEDESDEEEEEEDEDEVGAGLQTPSATATPSGMASSVPSEFDAPAGQALIERGRAGSGLFVLEQGEAIVEAPEGTRELGPGDVFGERSLLGEDGERTARVRARTDVRCLAIARTELERVLAESPALADRLRDLSA